VLQGCCYVTEAGDYGRSGATERTHAEAHIFWSGHSARSAFQRLQMHFITTFVTNLQILSGLKISLLYYIATS